jgi:hypothetical protein
MIRMGVAHQVASTMLLFLAFVQFIVALLADSPNVRLSGFGCSLGIYQIQIAHFVSFADEMSPFPFADWPQELDAGLNAYGPAMTELTTELANTHAVANRTKLQPLACSYAPQYQSPSAALHKRGSIDAITASAPLGLPQALTMGAQRKFQFVVVWDVVSPSSLCPSSLSFNGMKMLLCLFSFEQIGCRQAKLAPKPLPAALR